MTPPAAPGATHRDQTECRVFELRRYRLVPGQRDVLIDLFDRCFVESQEELGIRVIGQFRLRGDPDAFVWVRAFRDMPSRARALEAFYERSTAWRENRDAANATMIAFDDVRLLQPAGRSPELLGDPSGRPGPGAPSTDGGVVVAEIYPSEGPVSDEAVAAFESQAIPALRENEIVPIAWFVTDPSANTYPALPVREGEDVFVWFAAFPDRESSRRAAGALPALRARLAAFGLGAPEVLELEPTSRSLLRGK
jgi:hypothetical protein